MRFSVPLVCGLVLFSTSCLYSQERKPDKKLEEKSNPSVAVLLQEFVYEEAPFPECHASTLVETKEGVLAAWFGGTEEKDPDVGIWLSRRTSEGWSKPIEVANGIQSASPDGEIHRFACWNPILTVAPNGRIFLFYKVGPSPSRWWGMLTVSRDEGKTWSAPRRLPEGILGPIKNKPVWLKDGSLLCPTSTEEGGPWRVYFELAKPPFQKNWLRTAELQTSDKKGGIQPTILQHSDGRLQALCRCDGKGDRMLETWSSDDGKHWSELATMSLPNPNSGIDAVTLQDGRHALLYNHTTRSGPSPRGREMLNLAISKDGKTWDACETLELEANSEFSYPAIIQARDGKLHMTYTWKRKKIRYAIVDPTQLKGTPIVDSLWPAK